MDNIIKSVNNNLALTAGAIVTGAVLVLAANKYLNLSNEINKHNKEPKSFNKSTATKGNFPARIQKIIIYPIKSCKGIEVTTCEVDQYGFVNDRRFMLIHNNRFMSQRTTPKMSLITTKIEDGNLIISAPGMNDLTVPLNNPAGSEESNIQKASVWADEVNVISCGEIPSEWFSKFLEKDGVSLVQVPSHYKRQVAYKYLQNLENVPSQDEITSKQHENEYQLTFCDSSQIMFLSQSSIDELNHRINEERAKNKEKQHEPLTWERFRPNVLITGTDPFEEDHWKSFRIGNLLFNCVDHVSRCKLTTVESNTGILDPYHDEEPLRTLRTFRKGDSPNEVFLGVHSIHSGDGEVNVGDIIDVLDDKFESKNHKGI